VADEIGHPGAHLLIERGEHSAACPIHPGTVFLDSVPVVIPHRMMVMLCEVENS
jgi:hypothetical protein